MEAKLRSFHKTVPLVFGAFGEASDGVEQLIDARVGKMSLSADEERAMRIKLKAEEEAELRARRAPRCIADRRRGSSTGNVTTRLFVLRFF